MITIKEKYDKKDINQLPRVNFEGRIFTVLNTDEADKAVEYLMHASILGIDTETRPTFRRGQVHLVALLQVSTENTAFLFRLNRIGMPPSLIRLLEDNTITKVGLSLHDDLMMLRKRQDFTPGHFIELQNEVKELGIFAPVGALSGVDGWYAAAVLDVGLEPTNHVLNDLSAERAALEKWGRPIYLVATNDAQLERLHSEIDSGRFGTLPSTVVFCVDKDGSVLSGLTGALPLRADQLPLVVVANADGRVVFTSQGYTIGMGAKIAALAGKL